MTSFFHSYDLRGIYPDEINEEEAKRVGKAYGTFVDAEEVLIGRDGRKHGEKITQSFIQGIKSTGTDVVYAGVIPTPVVYFGQVENGFKSAAVVTASHNPPEYTGFKFNLEGAQAMSRKGGMKEIEEIYEEEEFEKGEAEKTEIQLIDSYISRVKKEVRDLDLKVAINPGNGVTGAMARKMFEELGCEVRMINGEVDGSFPNHLPDPTNENAQKELEEAMSDEDLGIIFDGDGDRAGFILPEHGYISEDEVIALLSEESLDVERGTVVYDLRASQLVPEKISENAGEPEETRVGHTFISERVHRKDDVVFAGELSGHFYFPIYGFPWDDGLFAGALMAEIVSKGNLSEKLSSFPDYPVSPELRIDCPQEAKQDVTEDMIDKYSDYELTTKDGVKIHFENGWGLVRPSSTEPKMSVRCEADTEEDLEKILTKIEGDVRGLIEGYQ